MKGFSSAIIQILALLTMTVDHFGLFLMGDFMPYRAIGRMAMPLFVLMLTEGFMHTRSRWRYFWRIVGLGVLAELPFWLLHVVFGYPMIITLLFGFAIGFVLMALLEKSWWCLAIAPIAVLGAQALNVEYGGSLIVMIGIFYVAKRCFPEQAVARKMLQSLGLVASCVFYYLSGGDLFQFWSLLALLPIWAYDGSKGKRAPRVFSYLYYPAHLLVIFLLMLIFYR